MEIEARVMKKKYSSSNYSEGFLFSYFMQLLPTFMIVALVVFALLNLPELSLSAMIHQVSSARN
ncbi:hypothetical protein DX541_11050 [Vibrio fluvialis]|jgi:hypothetical protein|nr:hypothetical protein [Vibrio fluvialis]